MGEIDNAVLLCHVRTIKLHIALWMLPVLLCLLQMFLISAVCALNYVVLYCIEMRYCALLNLHARYE
jgi:hypothetical protein